VSLSACRTCSRFGRRSGNWPGNVRRTCCRWLHVRGACYLRRAAEKQAPRLHHEVLIPLTDRRVVWDPVAVNVEGLADSWRLPDKRLQTPVGLFSTIRSMFVASCTAFLNPPPQMVAENTVSLSPTYLASSIHFSLRVTLSLISPEGVQIPRVCRYHPLPSTDSTRPVQTIYSVAENAGHERRSRQSPSLGVRRPYRRTASRGWDSLKDGLAEIPLHRFKESV